MSRLFRSLTCVTLIGFVGLGIAGCDSSVAPKEKMSTGKMETGKMGADKMTSDKMTSDKMGSDKMGTGKMSGDK